MKSISILILFCFVNSIIAQNVSEMEIRSAALEIRQKAADSIVHVSIVAQIQPTAGQQTFPVEDKRAAWNGTVVGSDGIVIVPLYKIDQSYKSNGRKINTPKGRAVLKLSILGFKDCNVIFGDGREIPAEVVLKDEQLGILCLRMDQQALEDEGIEMSGIDMENTAELEVMDYAVLLRRMKEDVNNSLRSEITLIQGLEERPQKLYLVGNHFSGGTYFDPNGKFVGFGSRVTHQGRPGTFVVFPAETIKKLLLQIEPAE